MCVLYLQSKLNKEAKISTPKKTQIWVQEHLKPKPINAFFKPRKVDNIS
jgi:hypothetical protein